MTMVAFSFRVFNGLSQHMINLFITFLLKTHKFKIIRKRFHFFEDIEDLILKLVLFFHFEPTKTLFKFLQQFHFGRSSLTIRKKKLIEANNVKAGFLAIEGKLVPY